MVVDFCYSASPFLRGRVLRPPWPFRGHIVCAAPILVSLLGLVPHVPGSGGVPAYGACPWNRIKGAWPPRDGGGRFDLRLRTDCRDHLLCYVLFTEK